MGIFSAGAKRQYLGVDIGSTSIKVVELRDVNHVPELVTYGLAELPFGGFHGENDAVIRDIAVTVAATCAKAGVKTTKAMTALPTYAVFTSVISLPKLSKSELASAIRWEAKKVIPLPIEDMVLDPQSLPEPGPNGTVRVLLTGAPKNMVERYIKIFKQTGLNLLSLETEGFALIRSLIGRDRSPTMILDLGASSTDIMVVDEGIPHLNRSIDIGGLAITKAIARSLNVAPERAEQFKYDVGIGALESPTSEIPKTVAAALAPILNEIKYTITLSQGQSHRTIEKIILTGGSGLLANFPRYLSEALSIRVYIGDPWARVRYPLELKGVLQESAARFAVAVGLAMRDIK